VRSCRGLSAAHMDAKRERGQAGVWPWLAHALGESMLLATHMKAGGGMVPKAVPHAQQGQV